MGIEPPYLYQKADQVLLRRAYGQGLQPKVSDAGVMDASSAATETRRPVDQLKGDE